MANKDNYLHYALIKSTALESGFKLKPQEDGADDLNAYVYDFGEKLIAIAQSLKKSLKKSEPEQCPQVSESSLG